MIADYYYQFTLCSFFTLVWVDGPSLEPKWQKFPQVSRALFNTLVDLNNAVIWTVLIRPLISNSTSPLSKPLRTIPSASVTIGIIFIVMLLNFFSSLARCKHLFLFLLSLIFPLLSSETQNLFSKFSLLFFVNYHLVWSSGLD